MFDEIKKHILVYLALFIVICVGIFLRTYGYSDLMHFELDQARDVFVVYDVLEGGVNSWPLLGPHARGLELYLGPIFYYFQIGAGALFGLSPETVAFPDLIFSLLAIPLIYAFSRLYYSRWVSVGLAAIFAVSLFSVIYGRFAWNPNAMPFWSGLTFYSLLRAHRNEKFYTSWFLMMMFGLGVSVQLHFIAFIAMPIIVVAYMLIVRMKVPLYVFLGGLALLAILHTPIIIHEYGTGASNTRAFFDAVFTREDSKKAHNVSERVFRVFQESVAYNWNMLSADNEGGRTIKTSPGPLGTMSFSCKNECRSTWPSHVGAIGIFVVSIVIFFFRYLDLRRKGREKSVQEKDLFNAHMLVFLWIGTGELFLLLVAYDISPRFFLFFVIPFLILLGSVLRSLQVSSKKGLYVAVVLVMLCVGSNVYMSYKYFVVLDTVKTVKESIEWRDVPMNRSDLVTLGQLRQVSDYINLKKDFIIVGDNRYARALYYLTNIENENERSWCYYKRGGFRPNLIQGLPYYVLVRSKTETHVNDEMLTYHNAVAKERFGTLILYTLMPKDGLVDRDERPKNCLVR